MIAPFIIVSWSIGEMLLDIARTNCSNVSQVEVELSEERPNCKHGSFAFSRPQHSKNQNSNNKVLSKVYEKYSKITQ